MRAVVVAVEAWRENSSYGANIDLRDAINAFRATQAKDETGGKE